MGTKRRIIDLFSTLFRATTAPFQRPKKRRALGKSGYLELLIEGEVFEVPPPERFAQQMIRRFMKREDPPRVNLMRLRRFVDEVVEDDLVRGLLVQVGPLGGGWSSADQVRKQLSRVKGSGREVYIHLKSAVGNRELLVASAGTQIWMTPSGALTSAGAAAHGLFLKEPLGKLGIHVEAIAKGRYKSGPDQFTRTERNAFDEEQTRAIVDAMDGALVSALAEGRNIATETATNALDAAPMFGPHAKEAHLVDRLLRDEEIGEEVRIAANLEEGQVPIPAGGYLASRERIVKRTQKRVGVVEVNGAIVDFAPEWSDVSGRLAVESQVVSDLRAALDDTSIDSVILLVNSPGGSVTASDAIYGAVRRLNQEKPVIACFSDVAASGGYYVACGARAIVASPLTITGSIGVYAMLPTWPDLAQMLGIGHDVIKNRKNAALYDPWSGLSDDGRAHAQKEIDASYQQFLQIVAEARDQTSEQIHTIAEGRVWTGTDARAQGLVDGLGGFEEAFERAKDEVGGPFDPTPVLVHTQRNFERPPPFSPETAARVRTGAYRPTPLAPSPWPAWLTDRPEGQAALDLFALLAGPSRGLRILAHWPWRID